MDNRNIKLAHNLINNSVDLKGLNAKNLVWIFFEIKY